MPHPADGRAAGAANRAPGAANGKPGAARRSTSSRDEAHALLDPILVGAEVKLQRDCQDSAAFYVIDLVDFEQVAPPLTMPVGFRSITEFGVQPNDGIDHATEIQNALRATTRLWFPPGEYIAQTIYGP